MPPLIPGQPDSEHVVKEKPILVTGAGGFIGSHLVEALLGRGQTVRAFVRYNSLGRTGWPEDLPGKFGTRLAVFSGGLRDARAVRKAAAGGSRIYRLAALAGIPCSSLAPAS